MCNFCKNFEFSRVKLESNENDARIIIDQKGNANFSPHQIAKYCPNCGSLVNRFTSNEFDDTFLLTMSEDNVL